MYTKINKVNKYIFKRRTKIIFNHVIIFLLILIISWYIFLFNKIEYKVTKDKPISYSEAIALFKKENVELDRKYYYKQTLLINRSRSKIPLIYIRDTIMKSNKEYYSIKIEE